jgi:hypothetical protein
VNLPSSAADFFLGNPYGDPARPAADQIPTDRLGGSGGFLSNIHNSYLTTAANRARGKVLVTRMRAPTFPDTRGGAPVMPGGQLRYFSMCQNEFFSQRFIACRTDDQSALGPDGFLTYVVSTPAERPANATAACGVTWLPWGPSQESVLIYRHMLPDPSFAQAIQRVPARGQEKATMGDYTPESRYYADKAAFEKLGCVYGGKAAVQPPSAGKRPRCRDRRKFAFRIHQPAGGSVRRVLVYVNGKRVADVRGRRVRKVVLPRLPRKRFRVRIVAITDGGSRTVSVRRYRGCRKGRPHTHVRNRQPAVADFSRSRVEP